MGVQKCRQEPYGVHLHDSRANGDVLAIVKIISFIWPTRNITTEGKVMLMSAVMSLGIIEPSTV